jgi:hypothetical protein
MAWADLPPNEGGHDQLSNRVKDFLTSVSAGTTRTLALDAARLPHGAADLIHAIHSVVERSMDWRCAHGFVAKLRPKRPTTARLTPGAQFRCFSLTINTLI